MLLPPLLIALAPEPVPRPVAPEPAPPRAPSSPEAEEPGDERAPSPPKLPEDDPPPTDPPPPSSDPTGDAAPPADEPADPPSSPDAASDAPAAATPEPVPAACPCEDWDWKCMQDNPEPCAWGEERPAPPPRPRPPATDAEVAPRTSQRPPKLPRQPPPPKWDGPQRHGILVGGSLGYWKCGREFCDGFSGGVMGLGEFGYRFNHVAPTVTFSGGRGKLQDSFEGESIAIKLSHIDLQIGALVFFAPRTIADPYFGAAIAYENVDSSVSTPGFIGTDVTRGAVRLTLGINLFVRPRFTIGPRFDISVPFGGKYCHDDGECFTPDELAMVDRDPSELPRVFSFGFGGRAILPVTPPTPPPPAS